MIHLALASLLIGAAAVITGAALVCAPAGLIVGGLLGLAAGRSLAARATPPKPDVTP